MNIEKIKIYIFLQISKYFFLILFIFLSVAWLLQITRLFTITNFLHIEVLEIINLSLYLIPNIISIIVPFITIFGLLLCFIKLNKENELISIYTLGFGLKPMKDTLLYFSLIIIIFFGFLNFYISPIIYEKYKYEEYNLRNTLDLNKIEFSNFLNLDKNTILDFNKKGNSYKDIFISFKDEKENLIYAKEGKIFSENNKFNFKLSNGFRISIDNDKQFEKLEFLDYVLKIENNNINSGKIIDKNTFTIIDDFKSKNYLNISFKFIDIILILFVVYFFYINNLRYIKFDTTNNIYFSGSSIFVLILNEILKNSEINILNYIMIIFLIIFASLILTNLKSRYDKN